MANPFVQSFKYDSLYRLIEAKETVGTNPTPTWKQNFGYDRFGNRIAFTNEINGQVQTNTNLTHPTIDANTNRFNTGQGYGFDKNGNLTTSLNPDNPLQSRSFIFNGENKQTEVKDASGNPIGKYFYDGEGKRVKKEVYANGQVTETTVFVYSNGKLVAEYSTLPPPTNPTTNYTMTDQLDSPRVITNALGEVTSRRDFKPFGEELPTDVNYRTPPRKYGVQDNIRQKFTGYQKDTETQLDFAEARMYQNLHGRFTAVDPLLASGKSANPQTFNRYIYVINNPLIFTDPTGLQIGQNNRPCPQEPCANGIGKITKRDKNNNPTEVSFFGNIAEVVVQAVDDVIETAQTSVTSLFDYAANSDQLANANFGRMQNLINATGGDGDAANALNNRLIGNQGPTTFSVLQGTTDAYKRAETTANIGFGLSNLFLGAAGMVGPRSAYITNNTGSPWSLRTPVNGVINIGGKYETPNYTNLNNLTDVKTGAGIRNLVAGDGQNLSGIFRSNSANKIISSEFPIDGIRDWNMFGRGAANVLKPGGQVDMYFRMGPGYSINPVVNGLNNAGFNVSPPQRIGTAGFRVVAQLP